MAERRWNVHPFLLMAGADTSVDRGADAASFLMSLADHRKRRWQIEFSGALPCRFVGSHFAICHSKVRDRIGGPFKTEGFVGRKQHD